MKLTTTAALLLGNLLPAVQSYGFFDLSLEIDDLDLDLDDGFVFSDSPGDIRLFLSSGRRAQQTISQQCLDDRAALGDYGLQEFGQRYNEMGCLNGTRTIDDITKSMEMSETWDLSSCPDIVAEHRAYCDANYQTVEYPSYKATCITSRMNNETQELYSVTVTLQYVNSIGCEPKSCPSNKNDYTLEDGKILTEDSLANCGCFTGDVVCTVELLDSSVTEEDSGVIVAGDEIDLVANAGENDETGSSGGVAIVASTARLLAALALALWLEGY